MDYRFNTIHINKNSSSLIKFSKDEENLMIAIDNERALKMNVYSSHLDYIDTLISRLTDIKKGVSQWEEELATSFNVIVNQYKGDIHISSKNTENYIFLKKIHHVVLEHLDKPDFGNSQLAHKMQISESQLFRKIKALTNHSTAIHIRGIRLYFAKKLVLNSKMNISEIAYFVGYNDPSYFTRTFLKEFGKTPSKLRFCRY